MTPVEKQVAALLIFFLMVGMSVRVYSARTGKTPLRVVPSVELEIAHRQFEKRREKLSRVSINRATLSELIALPKIGPAMAKKILDARQSRGPFKDKKDLFKIPGLKEGIYRAIEDFITFEP